MARRGTPWTKIYSSTVHNLPKQIRSRVGLTRSELAKACTHGLAGNKKDNITVIYTPWSNLKKDGSMATGQVGFKDNKKVCSSDFFGIACSPTQLSCSHASVTSAEIFKFKYPLPMQPTNRPTTIGQENTCRAATQPHRQPPEQDQSREAPRPPPGARGQTTRASQSRPSSATAAPEGGEARGAGSQEEGLGA